MKIEVFSSIKSEFTQKETQIIVKSNNRLESKIVIVSFKYLGFSKKYLLGVLYSIYKL